MGRDESSLVALLRDVPDGEVTSLVVALSEHAVAQALRVLWTFLRSPLPGGARRSIGCDFSSLEDLSIKLRGNPGRLVGLLREALSTGDLSHPAQAKLQTAIGIFDAISLVKMDGAVQPRYGHDRIGEQEGAMREERAAERDVSSHSTYVKIEDVQFPVTLRNVSAGGAMVVGLGKLVPGQRVAVQLPRGEWRAGMICWSIEDRFGVEFDEEA